MTAPDLPSAGPRSPAEGSTTGWVSPTALLLSLRRDRVMHGACAAGAHWFRRRDDGARVWVCDHCALEQPFVLPEGATWP